MIDGISSDNTVDLIKQYPSQVSWISERDDGIYDAMNKGILRSTGEWLYFLGADDVLLPDSLEMVFSKNYYDYDFIYGKVLVSDSTSEFENEESIQNILTRNISHQGIFYRRSLFERMGLYSASYSILGDYEFNLRCLADDQVRTLFVDHHIAAFSLGGRSGTELDLRFWKDKHKLVRRYFGISFSKSSGYEVIAEFGLQKLRESHLIRGIKLILLSIWYVRGRFFYIKNSIYWILKALFHK